MLLIIVVAGATPLLQKRLWSSQLAANSNPTNSSSRAICWKRSNVLDTLVATFTEVALMWTTLNPYPPVLALLSDLSLPSAFATPLILYPPYKNCFPLSLYLPPLLALRYSKPAKPRVLLSTSNFANSTSTPSLRPSLCPTLSFMENCC